MILEMHDSTSIDDLQEKFSGFYSNLRLAFFKGPHGRFEESDENSILPPDSKLGDIRKNHEHGEWEIHSYMKSGDLEQIFKKRYGLNVQVLFKDGLEWKQTADLDHLSLQELNELGLQGK
jgi:hypothetical protein